MSQLCTSSYSKQLHFSALFYDNLLSFVSFIYSHPVYLAYILYFSPYILQIFSFLFPLLLSTSILVLLLSLHLMLEGEIAALCLLDQLSSFIFASVGNVFEWEFEAMEKLYKNLDHSSEVGEYPVEIYAENPEKSELFESNAEFGGATHGKMHGGFDNLKSMDEFCSEGLRLESPEKNDLLESLVERSVPETPIKVSQRSEHHETSSVNCELSAENSEGIEFFEPRCLIRDSFVPQTPDRISEMLNRGLPRQAGERHRHLSLRSEITEKSRNFIERSENDERLKSQIKRVGSSKSERMNPRMMHHSLISSPSVRRTEKECRPFEGLQRVGSMRKEKEWKRTLGCKLYEERMTFKLCEERTVVEGAEEMDLLWEAYEADADKANKSLNKVKSGKKEVFVEEEEDDDEGDEPIGQLCCLKALRLSTGKLNFGVRSRNLAKVSKAFKGIGLFQRSSSQRKKL